MGEREINHIATGMSPQPRGWTTPPSLWRRWRSHRRRWRPRRQCPAGVFPPPICSSRSLFRGFCVSPALSYGKRRGTIFIVVFRSKGRFGKKDRRQQSHEGQSGGSHVAKESGRVGPCLLAFGPPLFRLLHFLPSKN